MDNKKFDDSAIIRRQMSSVHLLRSQLETSSQVEHTKNLDSDNAKIKMGIFEKGYSTLAAEIERQAFNGIFKAGDDVDSFAVEEFKLNDKTKNDITTEEFWVLPPDTQPKKLQSLLGYSDNILINLYTLATHFYEAKQHQEAIHSYAFLCLLNPAISPFWIGSGLALEANNELTEAQNAFENAIKCAPFEEESYLGMIRCSEKLKDFSKVIVLLTENSKNPAFEAEAKIALEYIATKQS